MENLRVAILEEAHRITNEYNTGTAMYGIGIRLFEILSRIEDSSETEQPRTTNLNFWEAYQAMKRGEWVGNVELYGSGKHVGQTEDGEFVVYGKSRDDWSLTDFDINHLESTAWYIVPKGPRYKVGDRFETDRTGSCRIIAVEKNHKSQYIYAALYQSEIGSSVRIVEVDEQTLDVATKLPD